MRPIPDLTPISNALGSAVVKAMPLSVGFGLSGLHVRLADGRELAIKQGVSETPGQLAIEGYMLRQLRALSNLPVPRVHYCDDTMLAMDWIEAGHGGFTAAHQRHLAELLAELHLTPRPYFGFEQDTVIAALSQPNPRSKLWVPFYRDHRLLFLNRLAETRGLLPRGMAARIEKLAARLGDYLTEPDHAALIHGDIWSGNVLAGNGRIAALIDPAIYFAHPEVELAFMTMFGSFGAAFFDAYAALTGFEARDFMAERRDLYLLYPLLVHVLVCSPSYAGDIGRILDKFNA